jgi:hypothetical protein
VRSAQDFWIAWWKAGGRSAGRRGAWRSLVAGHGPGRAAWILGQYRPRLEDEPEAESAEDVILVIASEPPLPDDERDEVAAFWEAIWRANGDREQEEEALSTLEAAVGLDRAQVIVEQYRPANLADPGPTDQDRASAEVQVAFLDLPAPDELETQRRTWSKDQ